jgi:WD40 repeat protein
LRRTLQTPSNGGVEFLRDVVVTTSTAGSSSLMQLWDTATLEPIGEPLPQPRGAYSLSHDPDGTTVVAGTSQGIVTIWDVGIERWTATACRIAGRNLTQPEWRRHLPAEPYRRVCPEWPEGS